MRIFILFLSFCLSFCLCGLDLVIPEKAHSYERLAADELKQALLSGGYDGEVRITADRNAGKNAIYFGRQFANWQMPETAESWSIRPHKNGLVIAGKTPIGTLYGCYALLRKLGVWFIAWDETVVPDLSKFKVPQFSGYSNFSFRFR